MDLNAFKWSCRFHSKATLRGTFYRGAMFLDPRGAHKVLVQSPEFMVILILFIL